MVMRKCDRLAFSSLARAVRRELGILLFHCRVFAGISIFYSR